MRVGLRLFVATMIATLISSTVFVGSAFAAPAEFERVDITVHTDQGNSVLLVAAKLPDGTPLPAQVELAVPSGQVQWAGEILGGVPEQDPQVEYTVRNGDNGQDVYSFTLTKSLIAQVEVVSPAAVTFDGKAYRSDVTWTPSSAVKSLTMSVRMSQGSQVASAAPGATVVAGQQGYSYYQRTVENVKAGQTESLRFAYAAPAAGAPVSGSPGGSQSYVPVFLGFTAVLVIAFLLVRSGRRQSPGADAVEEAEEQAEETPANAKAPQATAASAKAAPVKAAPAKPSARKPNQKLVILGIIAGVIGAFVIIAMATSRGATQAGDEVTLTVAQVDTCTTSTYKLTTPAGKQLADDADTILEQLRYVSGVGDGKIRVSSGVLEVNYCESNTNEQVIKQAIDATGYVAQPIATGPAGSVSASATPVGQ